MKPTKSFLIILSVVGAVAVVTTVLPGSADAHDAPMSTSLTPVMTDYFALDYVLEPRPSIRSLVACHALPACASSDSSRVRFLDASGAEVATHGGTPANVIEQVRRVQTARTGGVSDARTLVRRYLTDAQGRLVMNGTDSIITVDPGDGRRPPSTLVRVHRYADVRYLVNDTTFHWPMTGLVVLEESRTFSGAQDAHPVMRPHGAVSFDGTEYTHRSSRLARCHIA